MSAFQFPSVAPSGNDELHRWSTLVLDEIDYGVVVLNADARLVYANARARATLDALHPLRLGVDSIDVRPMVRGDRSFREAVAQASKRRLRRLVLLQYGGCSHSVAVVPVGRDGRSECSEGGCTLLLLGRGQPCETLSVRGFAACHGLTETETDVLERLVLGDDPGHVAMVHGVCVSTVRTQIHSIRTKVGALSIRALMQEVAKLPPLMHVLGAAHGQALGCQRITVEADRAAA